MSLKLHTYADEMNLLFYCLLNGSDTNIMHSEIRYTRVHCHLQKITRPQNQMFFIFLNFYEKRHINLILSN